MRARGAFQRWASTTLQERCEVANRYAVFLNANLEALSRTITLESGKPLWESRTEVQSSIAKVNNATEAIRGRRWLQNEETLNQTAIRYKPLGVMLVLGPYNLPLHLPGAHIVPALLAGNTVLFKPSENSPAVGDWIAQAWMAAGAPSGVVEVFHGAAEQAKYAVSLANTAGVLFTGSYRAGIQLHCQLAGRPECILALEMGGNNPLVIDRIQNRKAAIATIIQSAYITSGQRCTCARRIILVDCAENRNLIGELSQSISKIHVGDPLSHPQPFMGTLVSEQAAQSILAAQDNMLALGAIPLNCITILNHQSSMLSPGLLEVPKALLADEEFFGPLATVQWVRNMDQAIEVANQTKYGLAASLLSDDQSIYEQFVLRVNAGIVNWNAPTTGASGRLPFGGLGASGNHRPSGFFASDYCSDPVASVQNRQLEQSATLPPGLELI